MDLPRFCGGRRRLLGALGGLAALSVSGRGLARPALLNPCRVAIPAALVDSPWLRRAWQDIDPARVWDAHVHLAGTGDGGSGIEVGPELSSPLHPLQYAQRLLYMNAGCAHSDPASVDASYVARLLNLVGAMPAGFKVLLFAFAAYHDEAGRPLPERSTLHVPDAWARRMAEDYPQAFEWVASIHPYRPDAQDALAAAVAGRARAVKWLPAAMGMDPASPRCDRFYQALAAAGLPLIVHCGEEKAVKGGDAQALGNPLGLRRALDAGVKVVVAHCASLGQDRDLDQGRGGPYRSSFELFRRLCREPRAAGLLYGDISAITQRNRPLPLLRTLLQAEELHPRLLHGSDYPLPGILPLVSLTALARGAVLPAAAVPDLQALRQHNPLLFDFALKRLLSWQGRSFPAAVFHTRSFFAPV